MEKAGNPKMISQEAYTQSNIFNGSAGWPDAGATQVDHSSMKIMSALNTDEHASCPLGAPHEHKGINGKRTENCSTAIRVPVTAAKPTLITRYNTGITAIQ